jgi:hypothetical protein
VPCYSSRRADQGCQRQRHLATVDLSRRTCGRRRCCGQAPVQPVRWGWVREPGACRLAGRLSPGVQGVPVGPADSEQEPVALQRAARPALGIHQYHPADRRPIAEHSADFLSGGRKRQSDGGMHEIGDLGSDQLRIGAGAAGARNSVIPAIGRYVWGRRLGRAKRLPCAMPTPHCRKVASCSGCSTPSATCAPVRPARCWSASSTATQLLSPGMPRVMRARQHPCAYSPRVHSLVDCRLPRIE